MERSLRWKTLFLLLVTVLSGLYLVPSIAGDSLPSWFGGIFNKKVKLGLDLKGGLHIVYGIDLDRVVEDKAVELKRDFEAKLAEVKDAAGKPIAATVDAPRASAATGVPLGAVFVSMTDPANLAKIDDAFLDDYDDELEKITCPGSRPNAVCFRVASDFAEKIKASAIDQAIKTINERVDGFGVGEHTVVKKGEEIIVELPGTDKSEHERLRSIINRTALLEFKMVDEGHPQMLKIGAHVLGDPAAKVAGIRQEVDSRTFEETGASFEDVYLTAEDSTELLTREEAESLSCSTRDKVAVDGKYECLVTGRAKMKKYLASLPAEMQPDETHEISFEELTPRPAAGMAPLGAIDTKKSWRSYYLFRTAELTGTAISQADVFWDPTTNRPEVLVQFNRAGARRFGDLTSKNIGKRMAIVLDNKVNSTPVIQSAITGGRSTITMGGGDPRIVQSEAQDLVNVLRTGALPAPLVERSSSEVGAMLGQDAIDRAKLSMIVAVILVILMMLYFYRLSGLMANVAMVLNILFQVAILAAFQATLTLPGIAGVVLTIGMAVDSNIIINERIRDELRSGKSVRGAVDAGFGRAFWTVFDAHVTNFVAGFVLLEYGTGPIRGFAVMLLIGVVCNLFTSTWVSRLFFDHYLRRKKSATTISI
jgi:preprotein translocase subunit SecD